MAHVLIGLGANLGDRPRTLHEAVEQLAALPATRLLSRSTWLTTRADRRTGRTRSVLEWSRIAGDFACTGGIARRLACDRGRAWPPPRPALGSTRPGPGPAPLRRSGDSLGRFGTAASRTGLPAICLGSRPRKSPPISTSNDRLEYRPTAGPSEYGSQLLGTAWLAQRRPDKVHDSLAAATGAITYAWLPQPCPGPAWHESAGPPTPASDPPIQSLEQGIEFLAAMLCELSGS